MSEHDEIGEVNQELTRMFRVGLQSASRLAEQMGRAREKQIRDAEAKSVQAARELRERLVAERSVIEAQLRPVMTDRWWEDASHAQIADSWQQARGWQDHSQPAADAADRIRTQVQTRYGIDAAAPGIDPREIENLLQAAEEAKRAATDEQELAERENVKASELMAEADRLDKTATEAEGTPAETEIAEDADAHRAAAEAEYDSAERRDALAADMNAGGVDKETIGARMTADLDQAKHPRGAVQTGTGKPPAARKGRPGKGRSQERQHTGR
ncbi:hypothetical protein [Rhodococcus sp. UFZ-B548]|uniref:hypothetical protein n=1 Tax=Rhodococcus sp. UFZ-B548 TaxID=2742212 RepID=UPI0015F5C8D9|nr:hypothetical protein [Rhodococcus sp. UFZ-B548]